MDVAPYARPVTADPDAPLLTTVVDEAFVRAARRHVARAARRVVVPPLAVGWAALLVVALLETLPDGPAAWVPAVLVVTGVVGGPFLALLLTVQRRRVDRTVGRLFPVGSRVDAQLRPDGLWTENHGGGSLVRYGRIVSVRAGDGVVDVRTDRPRAMRLVPAALLTDHHLAEIRDRAAAARHAGPAPRGRPGT
ncbi:hypothetical protein GCM10023113_23240 [Cellulomonas oligotrophica]|uniref:DUF304 domain-containing protein n=1 Tax=Cellulomonas oligotrophica TaxID=931536 RepID=A0ABQ4D9U6_9CELL|nr:hypothetical protein Col01nite_13670 [Cellulomonas oligotrophica]